MSVDLPDEATICAAIPGLSSLALIARGGQKVVYRATHEVFGDVVLKLILADNDDRLRREIEAVSENRFSNVPAIYHTGRISQAGQGSVYLIEQYIDGDTLRSMLVGCQGLPLLTALRVLRDLLRTAVELERCRLVHRDIKPENIIIDGAGKVWLLDFGIARHLDKASITATVQAFGPATLGYAAPEQLRNLKRQIDIRADLFSIGVVAYETIAGRHPFIAGARDRFEVIQRTESVEPPRLTIPGDSRGLLACFVHQLMAKQVSRRPATAQQAMEWFAAVLPTVQGVQLTETQ